MAPQRPDRRHSRTARQRPADRLCENEGTQHVLYRGTDAHIHELWWNNEGWHHRDLTATVGAPLAESGTPSGYAFVDQGRLHVDYVGTDFHVHEFWRDGNGWHHNDLTAATGAPLALSNPAGYVFVFVATPPTQHVIYIADTHHVIELWWSPP